MVSTSAPSPPPPPLIVLPCCKSATGNYGVQLISQRSRRPCWRPRGTYTLVSAGDRDLVVRATVALIPLDQTAGSEGEATRHGTECDRTR